MKMPGFASRLDWAITQAGYNQSLLAQTLGVRYQSVHSWVAGKTEPTTKRIPAVANALGVTSHWLMTGERAEASPDGGDTAESEHRPDSNGFRDRVQTHFPALADHLDRSVSLGG